jgi:hypothetical protein
LGFVYYLLVVEDDLLMIGGTMRCPEVSSLKDSSFISKEGSMGLPEPQSLCIGLDRGESSLEEDKKVGKSKCCSSANGISSTGNRDDE